MVDEIIEQYRKLKQIVATFIDGGKENENDFIAFVKECIKEFSELLEKPEEDKEV